MPLRQVMSEPQLKIRIETEECVYEEYWGA